MKSIFTRNLFLVSSLLALAGAASVQTTFAANTDTWVGGSANFSVSGNWTYAPGPGPQASGDSLVFAAAGSISPNNDQTSFSFPSITYNASGAAYTIGGNAFTLGTGTPATVITINSANNQIINNNITLGNAVQTINAASGNLTLGGNVSGAGSSSGISLAGAHTLTLSNATYTGTTTLANTTTLNIIGGTFGSSSSALSLTAGGTMTVSGGTLLASAVTLGTLGSTSGTLTISGNANATNSSVTVGGGNNTGVGLTVNTTGNVSLGAVTAVRDNGTGLTIQNGTVTASSVDVSVASGSATANSELKISGGSLTITNTSGGLKISDPNGNGSTGNHTATLSMSGGTLTYTNNTDGLLAVATAAKTADSTSGILNLTGGTTLLTGITLNFANYTLGTSTLLVSNGASLYLGSVGLVFGTAGTVSATFGIGSATIGALANWSSPAPITLATGNATTLKAADPLANPFNITLSGVLSGAGNLTKTGGGTLTLSGPNTYSGGTTLQAGTAVINGINNLGGSGTYGGLTFNGGTLQYAASATGAGSLDLSSGSGITNSAGGATIDVNGNSVTYANAIGKGGSGGLTVVSTAVNGVLILNGANTYTGNTTINSGATFGGTGSLAGGLALASGAKALVTAGSPMTVSGALTLNGNTFTTTTALNASGSPYTLLTGTSITGGSTVNATPGAGSIAAGNNGVVSISGNSVMLTVTSAGVVGTWTDGNHATDDNWSDALNWSGGVPNLAAAAAILGNTVSAVNLDISETIGALTFNQTASYTISGSSTLTFDNSGAGGAITVSAGTANTILPPVSLNDNTVVTLSSGTALTLSGVVGNTSGSKTLTLSGAGTTVLANANTYGPAANSVGTILASGGTLQIGNSTALGSGDLSVSGNSTIQAGAAVSVANNIALGDATKVDNNGNNVTLSGIISGGGALSKISNHTLTLTGNNTYSGGTSNTTGQLNINNGGSSAANSAIGTGPLVIGGGIIDNTSAGDVTLLPTIAENWNGDFTYAGSAHNLNLGSGAVTLGANRQVTVAANTLTVGGVISGSSFGLTKLGSGTLTLAGANTYGGTTTNSIGTLDLTNASALQNSTLTMNGGTLVFDTGTAFTLGGLAASSSGAGFDLALLNNATPTPAAITLTVGGNNATTIYGGNLSGAGSSLVKTGTGTLTLSDANYTGDTTVGSSGNLTILGGSFGSPTNAINVANGGGAATLTISGGTATATNANIATAANSSAAGMSILGSASVLFSNTTVGSGGNTAGTLTINTTGNVGLGTNTLGKDGGNGISIQGGTVTAASVDIQGAGTTGTGNATMTVSGGSFTIGNSGSSGAFKVGDATAGTTHGGAFNMSGGTLTYLGTDGLLAVNGVGATSHGNVTVTGGTASLTGVTLNAANIAGATSALVVSNNAILYLGSVGLVFGTGGTASATFGTATIGALGDWSSTAPITLVANTVGGATTFQAANASAASHNITLGGALSGAGGLTKTGGGTLTLTNTDTYTGNTTISNGTLALGVAGSIANSPNIVLADGATLDVSALTLFTLGSSQTLSNTASATASLNGNVSTGTGTISLTYASGTPSFTMVGGTLTLASGTIFKVNNTGSALTAGSYKLISSNVGMVAGTAPASVSVGGNGIATPGAAVSLQITGNELYLVVGQATPILQAAPAATAITYGQTLGSSGLSGGSFTNAAGGSVAGSLAFTTPGATPAAGTANQSVTFTPFDTADYSITSVNVSVMVNPASLTPSVTFSNKVYDGTMSAPGVAAYGVSGTVGSDNVNATGGTVEAFSSKNVGSYSTTIITNLSLTGTASANYVLVTTSATNSSSITALGVTVTPVANVKIYDGTTSATGLPGLAPSLASGDTTSSLGEAYTNRNAGTGKALVPFISINDGNSGGNYALTLVTNNLGEIDAASLTVTNVTALDRAYDGTTTNVTLVLTNATLVGLFGSDSNDVSLVTSNAVGVFTNKNIGLQTLTVTGLSLTGNFRTNDYTLLQPTNVTASITMATLTPVITLNDKVYDGTSNATTIATSNLTTVVGSEVVTVSGTVGAFSSQNVGSYPAISITGLTLGGADAGNYALSTNATAASANITALPITVTAATDSKTYDGTTSSTAMPTVTSGALAGTDTAIYSQTYDNKNVGLGNKTLTPAALITDGNGGANYAVTLVPVANGTITAATLTPSITLNNKVYDGTPNATTIATSNLTTIISPDVVIVSGTVSAFSSKNAGNYPGISITGLTLGGTGAGNYALSTNTTTASANITALPITVTAASNTKVYDGTTSAAATPTTAPALQGTDTANFTEIYDTKNVGTAKTLTPAGTIADGNGGNNYTIAFVNDTTGVITAANSGVVLVSSANPSDNTSNVTFTATVTGTDIPTGTVQFLTNGVLFDTKPLDGNGTTNVTTALLPRGNNTIAAQYSGDGNYLPSTNSLIQVVTNNPPVANTASYSHPSGFSLKIALATLSTNWSDADGDTLTLSNVNTSTNGLTSTFDANYIYYPASTNADQFTYTISDGHGGAATGVVNLTATPPANNLQNILGITHNGDGSITINFASVPNSINMVQLSTNLINWTSISTNTAGTNGLWQFTDTNPPAGSAFYRSVR